VRYYRIFGPKGGLLVHSASLARVERLLGPLLRRYGRVRIQAIPAAPVTMYDSVDTAQIPAKAAAVAGYVNGRWPTFPSLAVSHPNAHRLSIAVTADADADCLDVEAGDARPDEAAAWVKRQHARGVARPVVYCNLATAPAVLVALGMGQVKRAEFRLWTAHYTGKPHRCTAKCGLGFRDVADATQYYDRALGRTLDVSLCAPGFFT
jgi:hypothetical protein